jgi:hypothetical protein
MWYYGGITLMSKFKDWWECLAGAFNKSVSLKMERLWSKKAAF